jgi:hypothetical protein
MKIIYDFHAVLAPLGTGAWPWSHICAIFMQLLSSPWHSHECFLCPRHCSEPACGLECPQEPLTVFLPLPPCSAPSLRAGVVSHTFLFLAKTLSSPGSH